MERSADGIDLEDRTGAGHRLCVEKKIYEAFVGRVAAFSKTLRVGIGSDPDTQVGPLVSQQQMTRVTSYLDIGRQEGAGPMSGGERLTEGELGKGFSVPPTVFAGVRDDMRIAQEEIFGPFISAIPFTDIEKVIERGNKTRFGLGNGIWTRDVGKAHRLAKAIRAGSVWMNCYQAMDPAVPFGGRSLHQFSRTIDAYATTAGARRKESVTTDGTQPGDPVRAAKAIIKAVRSDTPPFRLVLGRSAVQRILAEMESQRRDIDALEEIALGADFPDAESSAT